MFARWLQFLIGAWLLFAASFLPRADDVARLNDAISGAAIAALGFLAMRQRGLRRPLAGLGAWLVVAPWALSYQTTASQLNDVIVGVVVFGLALVPRFPRLTGEGPFAPPRRASF
jgi:hypothetical protein